MEKKLLNSPQQSNEEMDSKIAEMVLNNALLEFRKAKIREEIDYSLQERNKEKFLKLTEELKKIS
ncbi:MULTISPECIES: IDEAL domain-containing protein [Bacillaceae]|uniref:IDEAL domain-containing protein n=1 Tax=Bacillaceae TaxID=186817 RepID=UPI00047A70B8|nr:MULTISPECIES: IDEAL domain-containing protein [Bacillaceae]MBI0580458.1 IDEAL domain-containing protein [Neobacillus cucumis]MED1469789.1 IDEAL domain-containing protein [Bacillus salipaludis]WHY93352.1 IDEAL domain-containing protein [Neobacillus cucumis]